MSAFSSYQGLQIVSGSLTIPLVGLWTADVQLAGSGTLSGQGPLVIGNLSLTGTPYRTDSYGGQTHARIVGGAAGWRTSIKSQGYGNPSGVMMSTILSDAASACGEKVNVPTDANVGNGYARASFDSSVAADVLWHMIDLGFALSWYVDANGITQIASWPSSAVTTPFTVTDQQADQGVCHIATEDYASWLPGCTFTSPLVSGTFTSAGVEYEWSPDGKFRFKVLTSSAAGEDRTLGPIQQVIQKEIAHTRLFGKYRYTISNPSTTTIDCTPKNSKLGLPDLQNVPLMSDSISTYTPPNNGDCVIEFLDGYIPVCTWTAGTATVVNLLGGSNPVARKGDQTQSFLPPTLLLNCIGTAGPFTATATIPNPISGSITGGSSAVNSA